MNHPRDRIFVGQGFKVKSGLDQAIEVIERLLKNHSSMIALLEFYTPGDDVRQIDCALIGPGGVDLIEIKNKHGLVKGVLNGVWTVTDSRGYTRGFSNKKKGVEENPYDQARNTADDFKKWIKRELGISPWVSPIVWLTSADPKSVIEVEEFVYCALGKNNLPSKLRSSIRRESCWGNSNYLEIPKMLNMQPMTLSNISLRLVDKFKHEGIEGLTAIIDVAGIQQKVQTDKHGELDFAVKKGEKFDIAIGVPGKYVQPERVSLLADQDYQRLGNIIIEEKSFGKSEEEIAQELQKTYEDQFEKMLKEIELKNQQPNFTSKLEELNHALLEQLLKVQEMEKLLEQQARRLNSLEQPLVVQAQQAAELADLQYQKLEIRRVLDWKITDDTRQQEQAIELKLEFLTALTISRRLALAYPVQESSFTPQITIDQIRSTAKATHQPEELIDAEFKLITDQEVVPTTSPSQPVDPVVSQSQPVSTAQIPQGTAPQPRSSRTPGLVSLLVLGIGLAFGVGWYWQGRQTNTEVPAQVSQDTSSPAVNQTLPGRPVDTTKSDDTLPGVPVERDGTN